MSGRVVGFLLSNGKTRLKDEKKLAAEDAMA